MERASTRMRASAARRLVAVAAVLSIAATAFVTVADAVVAIAPAAAAPGSPGTPSAPVEVFRETFEVGQGATATRLADYVGVAGQTHTADPFWLREDQCNGVLLQYEATVFPAASPEGGFCVDGDQANTRNNSRRLADVIGQVDAGVTGSTSTATPVNGSTATTRTNTAVSAFTSNQNGPNGAVQLQTSPLDLGLSGSRFYSVSVDVAEVSCTRASGANNSRLRFALKAGATEYPLTAAAAIRACTDPRARYHTSPDLPGGWVNGGGYAAAGRFTTAEAQLLTAAQINGIQVVMRNEVGAENGNDAAFDNIRLLDATPQLDKSFSPAQLSVGSTSTLTLTVTNTSELAAKIGWGFTDALPAGLVVANPANIGGTCVSTVAATPGSGTIAVTAGRLDAGQASCTITVGVTSTAAGVYANCAANIQNPVGMNLPACASVEFSSTPFSCTADVVYGLNSSGEVLAVDRLTGASTVQAYFPAGASIALNGLGVSADGRYAYAVAQTGTKTVYRYDTTTGLAAAVGTIPQAAATNLFMGAVNPVDGYYYVGANSGAQYVFSAFDPATGTSLGERFRIPSPVAGFVYSDLTFDSLGRASVVSSSGAGTATANQLLVIESVPTNGAVATTRLLANLSPTTAAFQGAAFGSDGYLYAQHATPMNRVLTRIDPNSGAVVSSATILNPNGTANTLVNDLASCSLSGTLTLQKHIDGRYATGDQFTVTITGNGVELGNVGTTSGAGTGVQTAPMASAGPVVGVPGRTYTITETASGGTELSNYRTTWECRDVSVGDAIVGSGTGTSGTVTMPAASTAGSHLVCVFTNVAIPTWTLAKQALSGDDPLATGATVQPGDVITYRVTATNTSGAILDSASLSDDLSDVLDDASFVAGSAQLVIDGAPPVVVSDPAGTQLVTGPFALPGGASAVLTYRVTVGMDAWSATLTNMVTGTAGAPGLPMPPQPCGVACTTSQVTPTPVQIQKVGEASTGDVVPMDGSSWAIFAAAAGGTALVDPVPAAQSGGAPVTGLFRDVTLTAGTYWLEETRALDGFALLAQRVAFTVAADGTITLGAGVSSNVELVDVDGILTIRVEDVPALDLPDAGGPGTAWIYLLGIALLLAGTTAGTLNHARRRRAFAVTSRGPRA